MHLYVYTTISMLGSRHRCSNIFCQDSSSFWNERDIKKCAPLFKMRQNYERELPVRRSETVKSWQFLPFSSHHFEMRLQKICSTVLNEKKQARFAYLGVSSSGFDLIILCCASFQQSKRLSIFRNPIAVRKNRKVGCRHSSADSSALSILPPRVRVPSTPSMLFSIYICHLNWNVKRTKINKKRPGWPIF